MSDKLKDVLFGYGPEGLLAAIFNDRMKSRDAAMDSREGGAEAQVKYDGLVCSLVLKCLNEIRVCDGRLPVKIEGGRIHSVLHSL